MRLRMHVRLYLRSASFHSTPPPPAFWVTWRPVAALPRNLHRLVITPLTGGHDPVSTFTGCACSGSTHNMPTRRLLYLHLQRALHGSSRHGLIGFLWTEWICAAARSSDDRFNGPGKEGKGKEDALSFVLNRGPKGALHGVHAGTGAVEPAHDFGTVVFATQYGGRDRQDCVGIPSSAPGLSVCAAAAVADTHGYQARIASNVLCLLNASIEAANV